MFDSLHGRNVPTMPDLAWSCVSSATIWDSQWSFSPNRTGFTGLALCARWCTSRVPRGTVACAVWATQREAHPEHKRGRYQGQGSDPHT